MASSLHRLAWSRARATCEYCRMPQALDPLPFEVDHVIARQHGGETRSDNLALACFRCNKHKGPNLASIDRTTGRIARLFQPRRDSWGRHFAWSGPVLLGRTSIGRATVALLDINNPDAVEFRAELIEAGDFPPSDLA